MTDFSERLAALTPAQRELFERRRKQQGLVAVVEERIPRRSPAPHYPLSLDQTRLWFVYQFAPDSPAYNLTGGMRLIGHLDFAAMERSLNEVIRRHEILRTTFDTVDGQPVQIIAPSLTVKPTLVDLSHLPPDEQGRTLRQLTIEDTTAPFDLVHGPLVRMTFFRLSDTEHVFVNSIHHIVSDRWSYSIFEQELFRGYAAFAQGQPLNLPELPIQFADFAVWQRQWLQGAVVEQQLAYWKRQLADLPPIHSLPTDYPRPAIPTFRGKFCQVLLSPVATAGVKTLSRQLSTTPFLVLLALFKAFLARTSGASDLVVGAQIANRNRPELAGMIGFFLNTLLFRTRLTGNPSFLEYAAQVRDVAYAAYAHQELPLEHLVAELRPDRDTSRNPLFQIAFIFLDFADSEVHRELSGLGFAPYNMQRESSPFDLTLGLWDDPEQIHGVLDYSTDLFAPATIMRWVEQFQTLVEAIVTAPEQGVWSVAYLSAEERRQLLVEWNATARPYAADQCFHTAFEAQVARTPEAVAVVADGQQLTYGALNQRANQLAHHLRTLGVGPDTLVGLWVERSLDLLVGVLGILKAGGAYVPLDPTYPAERLAFMVVDAQLSILVTATAASGPPVPPTLAARCTVLDLVADRDRLAGQPTHNLRVPVTPEHLAYVIYTSGSTGTPKGVMIAHRAVLHLASALQHAIYRHQADRPLRVTLNAPLSFDASVQQLVTLLYGHTLYVLPDAIRRDGPALVAYLREHRLDGLDCVPAQLPLLLAASLLDTGAWVPALALVGGDALDEATWRVLADAPATAFYNVYGPTECTVDSTTIAAHQAPARPTIGRPLSNVQVYVLDAHGQPVPVGVPGELAIGGAGVARGYLHRPALSAEKFHPDPFSAEPGARLYHTGDLVRWLADGTLEFLGRIDDQIKLRGYRIELGEIEAVLRQHPSVREVVVIVREDARGNKSLVAYLAADSSQPPTASDLRRHLQAQLPDYMVPSAFVMLQALPLTPSGKLDRRALPALETQEDAASYAAPRTPSEELLAGIWADILGRERVGIHDNFFDLGGHSLIATQMITRVAQAFKVNLPLRLLFGSPTVAGLVQAIDGIRSHSVEHAMAALPAFDLQQEAVLAPDIVVDDLPVPSSDEPRNILLTDATAFVGAFLLHELLQQTSANVYCLVNASTEAEAGQRLRGALERYLIWDDRYSSRIIAILGDLSQPRLGLSPAEFDRLAHEIDVIYHNGAQVNFIYPYQALKATNVLGTQEILYLSSRVKLKPVHFTSTLATLSGTDEPGEQIIREDADLDRHLATLGGGYAQSKWVAEKLMLHARDRGLPVVIYRLGSITGHSATGVWNTDDFTSRMVRACLQLGCIPEQDLLLYMTPIDYTSKALIHLSRQPESIGKNFHLVSSETISLNTLIGWIGSLERPVERVPYADWRAALFQAAEHNPSHVLYPLLGMFPEDRLVNRISSADVAAPGTMRVDAQQTRDALAVAAPQIVCPSITPNLLEVYRQYFRRAGFLDTSRTQT